jgi:MFS family permease
MAPGIVNRAIGFLRSKRRNYRVAVARSSMDSFLRNLTSQYNPIYTTGLGANSVQLGALASIGTAASTLVSIPVGWLVDRYGIKKFFLLAILLSAGGVLLYALAHDWRVLIAAVILVSIATRLTSTGCRVICIDSVGNRARVTAQNLCVTLASITSMLSPIVGAYLITAFGGLNVEGIRSLYYVQLVGYGLIFVFVASQLREPRGSWQAQGDAQFGLVADFRQMLSGRQYLWKWTALTALTALPTAVF